MFTFKHSKKVTRLLAVVLVIAVMTTLLCGVASAASYNSTSGTLNGYACKYTLTFNSQTWGASGTATYGTTAASMYTTVSYTFRVAGTSETRTVSNQTTKSNSGNVALSVGPNTSCDANVSGSGSATITATNGAVWRSGVLVID